MSSPVGEGRHEEFAVVPFVHEVAFGLVVSWHDSKFSEHFDTPQFYSLLHPLVSVYSYINQFLARMSTQRVLKRKHDETERALQGLVEQLRRLHNRDCGRAPEVRRPASPSS